MDQNIKKINDILVNLFNMVLKMEEEAVQETAYSDLSITEIHTLVAIGTGRPRTMTHVANILGISVSTLTTAINKLVRKHYVERIRDEEDRRIVKIHLTEKGAAAVRAHEDFHEAMISEAVADVPKEDLQRFIDSIDGINQFLMRRHGTGTAGKGSLRAEPMQMKPIRLGAHELPVPIAQAGMGLGIADSRLAAAVAAEGGLGLIGTAGMESADDVHREVKKALELVAKCHGKRSVGKGLIGVSIMWNEPTAPHFAEAAVKAGAQVIVTSAAIPTDLPKYCSSRKVALLPTISSKRAASAIIRTWTRKYNRVPDGFILQGPLAAGMLGFRQVQLEKAVQERYKIIADVKAELSGLDNCPLIAGGGIVSRADAEEVYRYGADGFLMGTRFVTTEECGAPDAYKKLYLNCRSNDVTIIRSPMKTSVRAMRNTFTERIAKNDEDYDIIESVRQGLEGDFQEGLIFCSGSFGDHSRSGDSGSSGIRRIDSVRDVFREFTERAESDEVR